MKTIGKIPPWSKAFRLYIFQPTLTYKFDILGHLGTHPFLPSFTFEEFICKNRQMPNPNILS
jgi:hypothetical protein